MQDEDADDYQDNYVRRMGGSRADDNGADILDVAYSVGEEEYRYAKAVYTGGVLDRDIVAEYEPADGNPIALRPTKDPSLLLVIPY